MIVITRENLPHLTPAQRRLLRAIRDKHTSAWVNVDVLNRADGVLKIDRRQIVALVEAGLIEFTSRGAPPKHERFCRLTDKARGLRDLPGGHP